MRTAAPVQQQQHICCHCCLKHLGARLQTRQLLLGFAEAWCRRPLRAVSNLTSCPTCSKQMMLPAGGAKLMRTWTSIRALPPGRFVRLHTSYLSDPAELRSAGCAGAQAVLWVCCAGKVHGHGCARGGAELHGSHWLDADHLPSGVLSKAARFHALLGLQSHTCVSWPLAPGSDSPSDFHGDTLGKASCVWAKMRLPCSFAADPCRHALMGAQCNSSCSTLNELTL